MLRSVGQTWFSPWLMLASHLFLTYSLLSAQCKKRCILKQTLHEEVFTKSVVTLHIRKNRKSVVHWYHQLHLPVVEISVETRNYWTWIWFCAANLIYGNVWNSLDLSHCLLEEYRVFVAHSGQVEERGRVAWYGRGFYLHGSWIFPWRITIITYVLYEAATFSTFFITSIGMYVWYFTSINWYIYRLGPIIRSVHEWSANVSQLTSCL